MSKLLDFCMHAVPGPLKRRPKIAITLAIIGAIGTLGSGLAGFTDVLDFFYKDKNPVSEDKVYITHQQFNMLVVPMISEMQRLRASVNRLEAKIQNNEDVQLKSSQPMQHENVDTLTQTLSQVKELQTKQRSQK